MGPMHPDGSPWVPTGHHREERASLKEVLREKFGQNPHLKDRLLREFDTKLPVFARHHDSDLLLACWSGRDDVARGLQHLLGSDKKTYLLSTLSHTVAPPVTADDVDAAPVTRRGPEEGPVVRTRGGRRRVRRPLALAARGLFRLATRALRRRG